MQERTDDRDAIRRLAVETRRLGRIPTYAEMRLQRLQDDKSLPSNAVYERLGPKKALAARLAAFCKEDNDYADVFEIVGPLIDESKPEADREGGSKSPEQGFVYLLKSGRFYKLGHTNSVGRRAYELAIQLPEKPTVVHELATDDPAGIEAYWHKRFADRRQNGEWFELTREDISAFKRRKFM